jgi:hypothetical protein
MHANFGLEYFQPVKKIKLPRNKIRKEKIKKILKNPID